MFFRKLINDNCHALGAKIKNDRKYAPNYADIVVQSYHPVKKITTGEGGAILTNDPVLNKKFLVRFGSITFLFFTLKGIAWLVILYFGYDFLSAFLK